MNAYVKTGRTATASRLLSDTAPRDPFQVSIAQASDNARIDELRQSAYLNASYFSIPDKELLRRRHDPINSLCLIIANKQQIAATLRLSYAASQAAASKLLQGPAPLSEKFFPGLALCRGATSPQFRGQGLMTFLVGLGVAVARQSGLASATGMQALGTPHFGTMIASGWQSTDVSSTATECVEMKAVEMKLVYISRERFGYSSDYAHEHHHELHQSLRATNAVQTAAQLITRLSDTKAIP